VQLETALLELMDNTQSHLLTYRIDQVNPSDGSLDNGNFTWTGTGYIEPTLAMSDPLVPPGKQLPHGPCRLGRLRRDATQGTPGMELPMPGLRH
jgi:hypothetical protein